MERNDEIPMPWCNVWFIQVAEDGREVRAPATRREDAPWTRPAIDAMLADLRRRGARGRVVATDGNGTAFIDEPVP